MRRTIEQNRRFHMLIGLLCIEEEEKREIVARCTGRRTVHSHEMEIEEMNFAIAELKTRQRDAWRRFLPVIGLCCSKLSWTSENGQQIDWPSLNGYIEKYYHKKSFYKLTVYEIPKLIVSLKRICESKGIKV